MTREEAIEWMVFQKEQALAMSDGKPGALIVAYSMAIDALSAEAVQGWKTGKPTEQGEYMVTLKTVSDDYRFIDLLHYGKPLMPNCKVNGACWYRNDSEWGDVVYDDTNILAWMPLPKPYRENDEK